MNNDKTSTTTDFNLCLSIVDKLIDFNDSNCSVVDRVCGKGNFLLAVIYRFVERGCDIEHVVNNIIHGYDISESQIDHCRRYIKLATGVEPKSVEVKDSLNMKSKFTYEVGNYPFNDSSEEKGRDTDKLKENTGDLDSKFYLAEKIAEKRAVIIRSAFLLKKSKVRDNIMIDDSVGTIMGTTRHFDIKHDTMCVFSDQNKSYDEKEFIDEDGDIWYAKTDINTRLAPCIKAQHVSFIIDVIDKAKEVGSFKSIWNRPKVKRSNPKVNDKVGIDFVKNNGDTGKDHVIFKYDGDASDFVHLDKYRITLPSPSPDTFKIGAVKLAYPNIALSQSLIYFPFDTEAEAIIQKKYLESEYVHLIVSNLHNTRINSSEFFEYVPYYEDLTEEKLRKLNESIRNT